jgi:hypothetical protein
VPHPDSCSAASFGYIVDAVSRAWRDGEVGVALPLDGTIGTSVILVLNQLRSLAFGFKISDRGEG